MIFVKITNLLIFMDLNFFINSSNVKPVILKFFLPQ